MNSLIFFPVICSLVFHNLVSGNRNPAAGGIAAVRGYSNWHIGSYRCGLYVPVDYNPDRSYPLILYLHGYTDTLTRDLEFINPRLKPGVSNSAPIPGFSP
jgi:hypothetical protein